MENINKDIGKIIVIEGLVMEWGRQHNLSY